MKQVLREVKASEGIAGISEEVEAEAEVDDDFLSGDTYATYKPSKCEWTDKIVRCRQVSWGGGGGAFVPS